MGGAKRAQRRRRQQEAAAAAGKEPNASNASKASSASGASGASKKSAVVQQARVSGDRSRLLTGVVVVAVIAAVVIGGVMWQRSRSAPPDAAPVKTVTAEYPVTVDDGVVVAGEDSADVTVDVYEDFLCPACGSFEARDATKIEQALEDGSIRVRYHVLNLLDQQSNPPGYSLDAAASALCAADAGEFPTFHASLFADQPREGGRGYSIDQLVQLGRDAGITDAAFESCVRGGTHAEAVRAQLESARTDQALRRPNPNGGDSYFGTPTVVVGGKIVDLGNANWLDDAIGAAR